MDLDPEELSKTYSEYTDEKLLSMASSGSLTEIATKVLEDELNLRGISITQHIKEEKSVSVFRPIGEVLRVIIILCGCIVTIILLLNLSYPSIFTNELIPSDYYQGTGLAYGFIGLPINIIALFAHISWKVSPPIKVTTFLINFLPIVAGLLITAIDSFTAT